MKKLIFIVLLYALCVTAYAQNPSYEKKLYYTCKVWGYVKYFHSEVSTCKVNWDSVLAAILPMVKNAESNSAFNNALMNMIGAAGQMEPTTTPAPDELSPELRFNLNLDWFNDPILRSDVKAILVNIKTNFRPHTNCWVCNNTGAGYGWLAFPNDDPIINDSLVTNFPDEFTRLALLFRYWNIASYFNPYKDILDIPWDSTLYRNVINFATVPDYTGFVKAIKKMSSKLDDAHAECLTYTTKSNSTGNFIPRLIFKITKNNYVVVKSDYSEISNGDILESINGKPITQIEDSLRPYISSGNYDVFRRDLSSYFLRGDSAFNVKVGFKDYLGNTNTIWLSRINRYYDTWFSDYYPCDSLKAKKWKKYKGNIGYVNMGILEPEDVKNMYNSLYATKAIIFDVRNYPNGTITNIAQYIYPNRKCFVKFTIPDVFFPGTYSWSESFYGIENNTVAYKGKIIVLCNQETQSHAEFTCMGFQAMPDVVIVGSQTAGADGDISAYKMSKDIHVGFTTLGTFYPDGRQTQRIGIVPDSVVYPTAEGIRQGRDEVLDKAFEIARATVSVDENGITENDIAISPNPAKDYIEITSKPSEGSAIYIYNMLGEIVLTVRVENFLPVRVNVSNLPQGIYYLTLRTQNAYEIKKFEIVK